MTTQCEEVQDRLDEYVDGALDEAAFQEIELHLHDCAACREGARELRALLAEAASLPRETAPARDLWPGIAERIGARGRRVVAFAPRSGWGLAALAAAAAVVVAVSASLLRTPVSGPGATHAPGSLRPVSQAPPGNVGDVEADYERAALELLSALELRRGSMAPETLRVVDENLRIIDDALGQLRAALAKEPENPQLTHMLKATHQKKVDVLRRAMRLKA